MKHKIFTYVHCCLIIKENNTGLEWETSKSLSIARNQNTSQTVATIALYSASADDLDTMDYFLDFHEINESPKKMQEHVVELLVLTQAAQSESV